MYVVMFGMTCIEGAGLCLASLCVVLHCLWERDIHLVVCNGLVGIHEMNTPSKGTGDRMGDMYYSDVEWNRYQSQGPTKMFVYLPCPPEA